MKRNEKGMRVCRGADRTNLCPRILTEMVRISKYHNKLFENHG